MYENSLKLNKTYQTYAQTIQNYFKAFHQYCAHIKQPNQQKIKFLYFFKKYLYDYSRIMAKITDYQISCFQTNRENNNEDPLSMALHLIIQDANKFTPFQKQIRQRKQVLTKQFTLIKSQYINILKKMKKAKFFYDSKYMRKQFQPLISKISANRKGQTQILNQIQKINENSIIFLNQIDSFRKQLLKNKYRYHKKFLDLAINSKQSLVELFFYQYNCLNDYYRTITDAMNNQDDQFSMLRCARTYKNITSDPSNCISIVIQNTQDFLKLLQGIQTDLKTTEQNFQMITRRLKQYQEKGLSKAKLQSINKFFEVDQSPVQIILQTLDAFDYCFRKLTEKQNDCKKAAQSIEIIRKQVTKNKGITLSLLKVKLSSGGQIDTNKNIKNEINDQCGVYQFINTLDLKPVKLAIKTCLDQILYTFTEILTFFNQQSTSNRKFGISDSMQLSYMQKSLIQVKKKKPAKDQLWLWDQHKKKIDTEFKLSKQLFNEIMTASQSFKQSQQVNLQLQKYACFCEALQQAGQISISKNYIKFSSKTSERQLCIPLSEIEEVKRKTKIVIKDSIHLITKLGEIVFRQFQNSANVQEALKQIVQTGGGKNVGNLAKRQKIQLTQQEKKKIQSQARKQQLQKIRPNITQFQQIYQKTFQNIPLDQFYDLILSDKKFTLTGKQHDSFLVYAMKKYKNIDFKITNFQPPGPKYYTLSEAINFQNGPLFSQCKFQYKHLLNIPFLPSQCQNIQSRKVYWISDKQLDYLIHSQTKGVPMSDNFYVEIAYKVRQQGNNIILKVYAQIKFLKSFALKGTVESSTWKEIKEGTRDTVAQMQKGVKLYKNLLSGAKVQQQEEIDTAVSGPKQEMQKLRKRNLYLMIAVGVIILLNIVFKFLF